MSNDLDGLEGCGAIAILGGISFGILAAALALREIAAILQQILEKMP